MTSRIRASVMVLLGIMAVTSPVRAQTSSGPTGPERVASTVLNDSLVRTKGEKGLDLLYNMRSERARAHFQQIDARYPEHPIGPFLQGLNLWWTIMLDLTDTTHDEAFFEKMDEVIDRCEALLEENPDHFDALLFKGAAHGFKARLASNRSNWWKALQNGRKAIGPVRDVVEQAPPGNGDYVFGKGLYDYYTAILEEEYPVVKTFTWMIPDGNRERGLQLLRKTAEQGRYVQTEAIYYLTQVNYLYEEDYFDSRQYVRRLRQRHPQNPYFHNFEGRVYAKWGRWEKARSVFEEVVARCEAGARGYGVHMEEIARFYLARAHLYEQNYTEALAHLDRLDALTDRDIEDNRYRILGRLYQGMVYDAQGAREKAKERYRAVLDMEDPIGVHDRAERYLEDPYSR
ncbi:tetratricopeptide repeat protein [Salinibacter sp. 10B]|uniref:tetratricopeptide repeat protein n=1 Tax=Salinibacter sp. 10B TaxID=1923971 RepID=UPI0011B077AC|nr:tetratricopeptide repeat protein [Salinibacter sp. 10B]